MADKIISQLDSVTSVNGTELVPVVKDALGVLTTQKTTVDSVAEYTLNKTEFTDATTKLALIGVTQSVDLDAMELKLGGIEAGATADQLASEVPYVNTTSGLTATTVQGAIDEVEGRLDTAQSKLSGIEAGATADQTGAEIKALYEAEPDTNAFTDTLLTKLNGVESGATADQISSEVPYDNAISGLSAGNVKLALDELSAEKLDKNTAITGATHTKITYDAKGLVTSGSTPTTLAGYSIGDAYTKTETNTEISTAIANIVDM